MTFPDIALGWEPTTFSATFYGKFNYGEFAQDENIWAVFPAGLRTGAPCYILSTFTRTSLGQLKWPLMSIHPKLVFDERWRTFSLKPDDDDVQYYWFEGAVSMDGQGVRLSMHNPTGVVGSYNLELQRGG